MTSRWEMAKREAKRLVASLEPGLADLLAEDPLEALGLVGVVLRLRPEQTSEDGCSVDGSYLPGPPPTIIVAEAASGGRRCFSALHEYGHHLIRNDVDIHDLFADQADGGIALEEDVCDAVAAEILMPDTLVDEVIGVRGPTARDVVALFRRSAASREAACVRAAQRLLGDGLVMFGEGDVALFSASVGSAYRVARRTDQGPDSILALAARRGQAREKARARYRTGNTGPQLFADAVADEGYVFAVLTDSPAWEDFTVRDPTELFEEYEGSCGVCDRDFTTRRAPCRRCGEPFCSRCGSCWCGAETRLAERRCDQCTTMKALSQFEGDATICRDCS